MKKLFALLTLLLPLTVKAANPNVPLYVAWDGTVAAPTQFLAAVFHAGGGITITDNRTNLTISAAGGGSSTTNFVLAMGQDLTNLIYQIGANTTNFTITTGTALTNLIYQLGANETNFTIQTGTDLTNLIYQIGANSTNFTLGVSNYANSISNYAFQVWQSNSNYTDIAASNRVTVAASTGITVATNGSANVMTYTISTAPSVILSGSNTLVTMTTTNGTNFYVVNSSGGGGSVTNIGSIVTNVAYITNLITDLSNVQNDYYVTNAMANHIFVIPTNMVSGQNWTMSLLGGTAYTNFSVYFGWPPSISVVWLSITNGEPTTTITSNKVQFYSFKCRSSTTTTQVVAAFKEQP